MKTQLLLCVFSACMHLTAQKVCDNSQNQTNHDLNVISVKKCPVTNNDITIYSERNRVVKNSDYKSKRFLTIRNLRDKQNSLAELKSKKVKNEFKTSELESLVALPKTYTKQVYSFFNVDKAPLFRKCKKSKGQEAAKSCFNNEIINFVNENFVYPEHEMNYDVSANVFIKFIIDEKGKVNNIKVSGAKEIREIKEEVVSLIYSLPRFIPAQKDLQTVPVSYEFELDFSL